MPQPGPLGAATGPQSHWRGDLPLPRSFWVHTVLPTVPLGLALAGLLAWMNATGDALRAGSAAVLLGWPLLLALGVWAAVGAWRSAGAHVGRGGTWVWALAARVSIVAGVLTTLAATLFDFAPWVGSGVQQLQGIEPAGRLDLAVSADGRRLQLKGRIGAGDAARVQQALGAAPGVRIVEIESPGGRLAEAERVAALLRQRAVQTRANGYCDGACTVVFMAGAPHQVMPGALLGFYRTPRGSINPLIEHLARRAEAAAYRRAGLPEGVITRLLKTPAALVWRPPLDELAVAGVVSPLQRTLDVGLPLPTGASAIDWAEALQVNPTWHALEQRFPGSIDSAAQRMQSARAGGASDAVTQAEAQRVVEALLPRLLQNAGPALHEQFIALLADQLQAARSADPATCKALLTGEAAGRRSLPVPLVERESSWLAVAAVEPERASPPRAPTALELEVLRRSLGDAAPAQLMALRAAQRADEGARACDKALALLRDVLALPVAQRRLAARLLLEQR